MFNNFLFANRAFYEIMCTNMSEQEKQQMSIKYGACALRVG
jgi:hypothetical protein